MASLRPEQKHECGGEAARPGHFVVHRAWFHRHLQLGWRAVASEHRGQGHDSSTASGSVTAPGIAAWAPTFNGADPQVDPRWPHGDRGGIPQDMAIIDVERGALEEQVAKHAGSSLGRMAPVGQREVLDDPAGSLVDAGTSILGPASCRSIRRSPWPSSLSRMTPAFVLREP